MRRRLIDHVWVEEVTVTNHRHEHSEVRVALEVDADFADLFEVKDGVVAKREVSCRHDDGTLTLAYERAGFQRSVTIAASRTAAVTRHGFAYSLRLAPGEQWSTTFTLTPHAAQPGVAFAQREQRGSLGAAERLQVGRARAVAGRGAGVADPGHGAGAHLPREPQ